MADQARQQSLHAHILEANACKPQPVNPIKISERQAFD